MSVETNFQGCLMTKVGRECGKDKGVRKFVSSKHKLTCTLLLRHAARLMGFSQSQSHLRYIKPIHQFINVACFLPGTVFLAICLNYAATGGFA